MPRYGFNFQWMFWWEEGLEPAPANEKALDFLVEFGFDFVRIPASYWFWTSNFDYENPDESVLSQIDQYLQACRSRELHMSLNLHRAPGYCINDNHLEKHNLWQDTEAQDAFVFEWQMFATRYKGVPNKYLSFDLVNEPPNVGQYGMTRDIHEAVIRRTVAAIRAIDPEREIVIDGLGGGHIAMPELADLDVIHSGRGYQPMPVSHYKADWWPDHTLVKETPIYPNTEWAGKLWNKDVLREFYQPWRDVQTVGAPIHIGEFGCYNQTPNDVALRWFADILSLYKEFGWGYSLWEFDGVFGIVEHGRAGAAYEDFHGFKVDRTLLDLLLANRV